MVVNNRKGQCRAICRQHAPDSLKRGAVNHKKSCLGKVGLGQLAFEKRGVSGDRRITKEAGRGKHYLLFKSAQRGRKRELAAYTVAVRVKMANNNKLAAASYEIK
jgi:hypothetical protein